MFEIEKGIKVPKRRKYPFHLMENGDSFFVEVEDGEDRYKLIKNLRQLAYFNLGKGNFATKAFDNGIRVWKK